MPKCANHVCLNDVKVGFKTETYCRSCIQSDQPYVFECDICKVLFTPTGRNSVLHKSCSDECRRIKHSLLSKARYKKLHPPVSKPCPSCGKIFAKNTKYCSYGCHTTYQPHIRRMKRYFSTRIPAMTPYFGQIKSVNERVT